METPHQEFDDANPFDRVEQPFVAELVEFDSTKKPAEKQRSEPLSAGGKIAWLVIVLVSVGMFVLTAVSQQLMKQEKNTEASVVDLMPIQLQGKVLVGQASFGPSTSVGSKSSPAASTASENEQPAEDSSDDPEKESSENGSSSPDKNSTLLPPELDVGPYEQRLCYSILLSELQGPKAAIEHLQTTDERAEAAELELTDSQKELRQSLGILLENYQSGDFDAELDPSKQEQLKQKLGWLGELVLVPKGTDDEAERSAVLGQATKALLMTAVGTVVAGGCLFVAFIVSIVMMVMISKGWIRPLFQNRASGHNIYAETFAIWIAGFFGAQIILPVGFSLLGLADQLIITSLLPLVFFGSLIVLVWPVLRGIPFSQVRQDIGWKFGTPLTDAGAGLAGYLTLIPALVLGIILLTVIISVTQQPPSPEVFSSPSTPGHPMQELAGENSLAVIGLMVLVACVAAPIVEETMFRGVLYRHLRDWIPGSGRWASVFFACLVNSFVFAAIHPQGLMGIPVLGLLAVGFSLVREWRDSLFGPMLMHALNNGIITLILFTLV